MYGPMFLCLLIFLSASLSCDNRIHCKTLIDDLFTLLCTE
jgi:hypothetical protein